MKLSLLLLTSFQRQKKQKEIKMYTSDKISWQSSEMPLQCYDLFLFGMHGTFMNGSSYVVIIARNKGASPFETRGKDRLSRFKVKWVG